MHILHLTDFHYKGDVSSLHDQKKLVQALINSLKGELVDVIFFTGDLVDKGADEFNTAYSSLLEPLAKALNISPERIYLCGGNHDLKRGQEFKSLKEALDRIDNNHKLDGFVKDASDREYRESLKNVEAFINFQRNLYKNRAGDVIEDLYTVHKIQIDNKSIGIATINTAWRSFDSEKDKGNLLFPLIFAKKVIAELKETEFKILLLHHSLSDLKDFNGRELEDIIFQDFHMMFSGHIHKRKQSTYITSDEGIFCCIAPASLSEKGNAPVGYTLLNVDTDTYDIDILNAVYNTADNVFMKQPLVRVTIPVNSIKREQNDFRKVLRKKLDEEVENANDLFISFREEHPNKSFEALFTLPILKTKSRIEEMDKEEILPLPFSILLDNKSFIIYGKDKSGKSSLLKKIQIDLLRNFSEYKGLPLYIDCKEFKNSSKTPDISSLISKYYEVNRKKGDELVKTYGLRILLDNFDPANHSFNIKLKEYTESHRVSFIACTEDILFRPYDPYDLGTSYTNLFLHEISRKEIRSLIKKWPNIPEGKKDAVLDKIVKIFAQMNIPYNYWTVSLFLWIFEKTNESNFHNNFELIQLYIDGLLDRKGLTVDKHSKIDFEEFRTYLGELAHYLLIFHKESGHSASYADIVKFTHDYKEKDKRFVIEVEQIINLITSRGILKKGTNERYTFRLNGVFEFFLAHYMRNDQAFRYGVIYDNHYYLSFSNELELYSGLEKKDEDFVQKIFEKTQSIFDEVNKTYEELGSIDKTLESKVRDISDLSKSLKELAGGTALLPEEKDKLMDDLSPTDLSTSEVSPKKFYPSIEKNSENLGKALFILGRVFRNSSLRNDRLNNAILDYLLNSACNLGFVILDEVSGETNMNVKENEGRGKFLMQMAQRFMPVIIQITLFDALAQNNLERIIGDKIIELKKDGKNNQFKLLLCYFLLIDLDPKNKKDYINEAVKVIELNVLKQTVLLKLYTYIMMYCHNNHELEKYLRNKIEELEMKLNPKKDKGELHSGIEQSIKMGRVLKNE